MAGKGLEVTGGCAPAALPHILDALRQGRLGRVVLVRYALRVLAPARAPSFEACLGAAGRHAVAVLAALSGPPPTWAFGLRRRIAPGAAPDYLVGHFLLADGAFATLEAHVAPHGEAFSPREELVVVASRGMVRAGADCGGEVLVHDSKGPSELCRLAAEPPRLTRRAGEADWRRLPGVSPSVVASILGQLAEGDCPASDEGKHDGR